VVLRMLPCFNEKGLSLFAITADQRFMIGEDSFLSTHFPITLKRFREGKLDRQWTEGDLYNSLLKQEGIVPGNRVYVLYGAAGSGKSELMRWLECQLKGSNEMDRHFVRISRTELDPVRILQKIMHHFRDINVDSEVLHRWDDLRNKPVTLANHLVWSALCRLLSDDNQIIPLSYKLRPIIEENLKQNFGAIENPSEIEGRNLELISMEELEELTRQCAFPVDINYEQVRAVMVHEMEQMILGGFHFVESLKAISFEVAQATGRRPMLLIDDLVQSMNLYASDILDFFITMEEGCWDIVVGLTPASFEVSKRGRELLKRITYLDTFDDRLVKLWLTDEQGHESFFINAKTCSSYAKNYMKEYKRQGGYVCGSQCKMYRECVSLQFGLDQDACLSPFNPAVLEKIFVSLPKGKGKARYFIMALGEAIQRLMSGEDPQFLAHQVRRQISADYEDEVVRLLAEVYAPFKGHEEKIVVPGPAIKLLSGKGLESDIQVDISALGEPSLKEAEEGSQEREKNQDSFETYLGPKEAIRDWLEGNMVNKELLRGLRLGVAHFSREIAQPSVIAPQHTARSNALIRWDEAVEGSKVPVQIEGVDKNLGIPISRSIGHAAYELHYLHLKKAESKRQAFEKICAVGPAYLIAHRAYKLRSEWSGRLGRELGRPAEEVFFLLFLLLIQYKPVEEVPAMLAEYQPPGKNRLYPDRLKHLFIIFSPEEMEFVNGAFKDWLLLRENVYNGLKLRQLTDKYSNYDLFEEILNIKYENVSPHYKVSARLVKEVLSNIRQKVEMSVQNLKGAQVAEYLRETLWLGKVLRDIQNPGMYEALSDGLILLSRELGEHAPRQLPSLRKCERLYKNFLRLVGKEIMDVTSYTELQKSPTQTHKILSSLGILEQDSSMDVIRKALTVGGMVLEQYVDKLRGELLQAVTAVPADSATGASLYRRAKKILVKQSYDAGEGAEAILEVIEKLKELIFVREYLGTINRLLPYVEANRTVQAIEYCGIISKLCAGGNVPPGIKGRPQALVEECDHYLESLRKLTQGDSRSTQKLAEVERNILKCCQVLQKVSYNLEIINLVEAWQKYLQKLLNLCDLIYGETKNIKLLIEKVQAAIEILRCFDMNEINVGQVEEVSRLLKEIVHKEIFKGIDQRDIMRELKLGRESSKVVAKITQGEGTALSSVGLSSIKEIKEKVPALASEINLKLNF